MGERELIYIIGCNRSGTTLLQNLFRCAKNTRVVNGEISPQVIAKFKNEFVEDNLVFKRIMVPGFGMNVMARAPMVAELRKGNSRPDPTVWLDWVTTWNKIHYVHIRRDPRDALVSTLGRKAYVNAFPMWEDAERIYKRLREELPNKTHLIKYEELVNDVDGIMGDLFLKLNLELAHPFELWVELLSDRDKKHQSMSWLNQPRPVDSRSVGGWCDTKKLERIRDVVKVSPKIIQTVVDYGYDKEGWEKAVQDPCKEK